MYKYKFGFTSKLMEGEEIRKFVKEGLPAGLIGIRERNKLDLIEKRTIELIITISNKKIITKTPLAHELLIKLGKKISEKPEWKRVKGKEVEEFLKYREGN
jgi:hypothetical protein